MKKIVGLSIVVAILASCNNQQKITPSEQVSDVKLDSIKTEVVYTPDMVVNKKDYSCGMPVSAGISDTCHYEGKAYGFCSSECKADFLKDPKKYIAENKE